MTFASCRRLLLVWVLLLCGCGGGGPTATSRTGQPLVYAALGASDAVGIGAFPLTEGYVYRIHGRLEARGPARLVNLGINGAPIEQLLGEELDPAIAAAPDVVTIWTGPNDVIRGQTPERFGEQLDVLLAELRSRTSALVLVGDVPDLTRAPLFRLVPDDDVTAARLVAFNRVIADSALRHGAIVVRLSAMVVEDSIFAIDGFHPNNSGHLRLADLFWSELEPRL